MHQRKSGLFLPVSSLPGPYGIGSMGRYARAFVDFLAQAGQSFWQVLPLVPTGYGDSPYQSSSSAAGNPYFIDLDLLQEEGLLEKGDFDPRVFGENPDRVDYVRLYEHREKVLRLAFRRFQTGGGPDSGSFQSFVESESPWLSDYALFAAVKRSFGDRALAEWPDGAIRAREPAALERYGRELEEDVLFHKFVQYLFYRQWRSLRDYAAERGVKLLGDMPIYVSADSAEVWAHPELFQLSKDGAPTAVAGVPPDDFSATGQLWGNPLYNWEEHRRTGYKWWLQRIRRALKLYDLVRIDHFRGFCDYWSVPADSEDATGGKWVEGPGMDFIRAIRSYLPDAPLVAEDLGDLNDRARKFFRDAGYPGMGVLVQSFSLEEESAYLPHNRPQNSVYYTSTHDSETFIEWLTERASPEQQRFASRYLRLQDGEGLNWGAVKSVWASPALLAIAPLQDILGLGGDARINRPSTLGGVNWQWRVREEALNRGVAGLLREVTETYWRL